MPNAPRAAPKKDRPRCPPHPTSLTGAVGTVGFLLVVGAEKGRAIGPVVRDAWLVSVAAARANAGAAGAFVPSPVSVTAARSTARAAVRITGRACSGDANRGLDRPDIRFVRGGALTPFGSSGRPDSWI